MARRDADVWGTRLGIFNEPRAQVYDSEVSAKNDQRKAPSGVLTGPMAGREIYVKTAVFRRFIGA